MATSDNRQYASKIKFYPSYPLYAYANGLKLNYRVVDLFGDSSDYQGNAPVSTEKTIYSLINLTPHKRHIIGSPIGTDSDADTIADTFNSYIEWQTDEVEQDFCAILNHNFYSSNQIVGYNDGADGSNTATLSINDCKSSPAYDGWSLYEMEKALVSEQKITFNALGDCEVGSVLWGKSWETPINCDINQSFQYIIGNRVRKTLSGKSISTLNYAGPKKWGDLHAWELSDAEPSNNAPPSGLRKWTVNFTMLGDQYLLPQNAMLNSNNFTKDDSGNYTTYDDGGNDVSTYNRTSSPDFMTSVYRLTMGSHLPVMIRISESNNPDQFAIVRIVNLSTSKSMPNFTNISMTLEEQI
tara:strand:- start:1125 stop:2186 length:1062 start_codon:yes stop_codon:yes gene_type:complete